MTVAEMSDTLNSVFLRVVVAQLAKNLGFSSSGSSCLNVLQDLFAHYLQSLAKNVQLNAEQGGRNQPIFEDCILALNLAGASIREISDYVEQITPCDFTRKLPSTLKQTANLLNIPELDHPELKTRPDFIPSYLPLLKPDEPKKISNGAQNTEQKARKNKIKNDELFGDDWLGSLNDFDAFKAGLIKIVETPPMPITVTLKSRQSIMPLSLNDDASSIRQNNSLSTSSSSTQLRRSLPLKCQRNDYVDDNDQNDDDYNNNDDVVVNVNRDDVVVHGLENRIISAAGATPSSASSSSSSSLLLSNDGGRDACAGDDDASLQNVVQPADLALITVGPRWATSNKGTNEKRTTTSMSMTMPTSASSTLTSTTTTTTTTLHKIRKARIKEIKEITTSRNVEPPTDFSCLLPTTSVEIVDTTQSVTEQQQQQQQQMLAKPESFSAEHSQSIDECISNVLQTVTPSSAQSISSGSLTTRLILHDKTKPFAVAMTDFKESSTVKERFESIDSVVEEIHASSSSQASKHMTQESDAPSASKEKTSRPSTPLSFVTPKIKTLPKMVPVDESTTMTTKSSTFVEEKSVIPYSSVHGFTGSIKTIPAHKPSSQRRKGWRPAADTSTLFKPDVTVKRVVTPTPLQPPIVKQERKSQDILPQIIVKDKNRRPSSSTTSAAASAAASSSSSSSTKKLGPLKIKLQIGSNILRRTSNVDVKKKRRLSDNSNVVDDDDDVTGGTSKKRSKFEKTPKMMSRMDLVENASKPTVNIIHQPVESLKTTIITPTNQQQAPLTLKIPKLILKLGSKPVESLKEEQQKNITIIDSASLSANRFSEAEDWEVNQVMTHHSTTVASASSPPPPTPSPRSITPLSDLQLTTTAATTTTTSTSNAVMSTQQPATFDDCSTVEHFSHVVMSSSSSSSSSLSYNRYEDDVATTPQQQQQQECQSFEKMHQNIVVTSIKPTTTTTTTSKRRTSTDRRKTSLIASIPKMSNKKQDIYDEEKVWYCPICQIPYEEGVDMIACDKCDHWFHWTCVGLIQAPPDDEPWYCTTCASKKHKVGTTLTKKCKK